MKGLLITVFIVICLYLLISFGSRPDKSRYSEVSTWKDGKQKTVSSYSNPPTNPEAKATFWEEGTFRDKFGEPTKEKYIQTEAIGKFSNSATSNSFLKVEFIVNPDGIFGIFMHEYSSSNPAVYFIGDGVVMARNSSGKEFKTTNIAKWSNEGGIGVHGGKLVPFLKNSVGDVKIHVEDEYSSTYDFVIKADGFASAYDKLNPTKRTNPKAH